MGMKAKKIIEELKAYEVERWELFASVPYNSDLNEPYRLAWVGARTALSIAEYYGV